MSLPLFNPNDTYHLNTLIAQALTEPKISQRLLRHDRELIVEFELSCHVWSIIVSIQARSLEDFCRQLVNLETHF